MPQSRSAGLMGPPLIIVIILAALYARFGDLEVLGRILAGITAAATGLLIAVVAKMAAPLFRKRWDWAPLVAIAAFIGVAIMQWPLPLVFVVLAPVSVACAWMTTMNDNSADRAGRLFCAVVAVCGRRRQTRRSRKCIALQLR